MSFRLEQNLANGWIPVVRQRALVPGSAGRKGHLLTQTAAGQFAEVVDPDPALATIAAVALSDWGPGAGSLFPLGTREFPPGFMQAYIIQDDVPFLAQYVGALPATEGGTYGVVRHAGLWKVDFTDTVATRVRLVDLRTAIAPTARPEIGVVFLPGFMQLG